MCFVAILTHSQLFFKSFNEVPGVNLQKVAKVKLEKTTSSQVLYCFIVWITVSAFYAAIQCYIVHLMKYGHAVLLLYAEILMALGTID